MGLKSNHGGNFAFNIPTLDNKRPFDLIIQASITEDDTVQLHSEKVVVRIGGVLRYSKDFTYSQTIDPMLLMWDTSVKYTKARVPVTIKDARSFKMLHEA